MPKAQDLTHDLVTLRGRTRFASVSTPLPPAVVERALAFNPWSTLFWTLVLGALGIQGAFILWLA